MNLFVTLSPSMPHFARFAKDERLQGIRINSAMMHIDEISKEMELIEKAKATVPLWFDIKGRQLRITNVILKEDRVEIDINHPISVDLPVNVLFKAGRDVAELIDIKEKGTRLIFTPKQPHFSLKVGESIHIRHPSLKIHGPLFTQLEKEKIKIAQAAGFSNWCLSYVESLEDILTFREQIQYRNHKLIAKIENKKGLNYAKQYKPLKDVYLMAARGDLYVELDRPHDILPAMRDIIKSDKNAFAGSRMLLTCIENPLPEAADLAELAWLYDIGYRNFMLCDDLCIREDRLVRAVNVFEAFRNSYVKNTEPNLKLTVHKVETEPNVFDKFANWCKRLTN